MRRQLMGLVAVATLVGLTTTVKAQDSADGANVTSGGIVLDPITIFATLSPIEAYDYPGQVGVVTRDDIETRQPSTLSDLLEGVPGVVVDGGPRRTGQTPTIRGSRGEDVLILLDGVRQSFISGHDGRVFIEPELLKQVEIVKGPASALYGSGALGGVIALTTVDASDFLEPGKTAGVRLKAGYESASDEYVLTSTGFARSDNGKVDALASFSYRDSGNIELGDGSTLPSQDEIKSALVKSNVQLSEDMKFTGTWVHYQDDALDPQNPQGVDPGGPDNPLVNRLVKSDTVSGKLAFAPADNPLIDGSLLAYWARNEVKESNIDDPRIANREVETVGVKADNRSRFDLSEGARLTLTYGGEYYQDKQTGTDNNSTDGTRGGVPNATADFAGAFAQAELKLLSPAGLPGELTILPGIRFDRFTNQAAGEASFEDQAISPKLGVTYKPQPWLMFFGSYGEAFRAPSFNELYADGVHFQIGRAVNNFIPNPDLKPQSGWTLEGGMGLDFNEVVWAGDKLKIKGSYWKSEVDDFIDLQVNGVGAGGPTDLGCFIPPFTGCTTQYINVANAELHGFELEARYEIGRLYGIATYSNIDGRDKDTGEFLGVLQPDKVHLNAGVKLPEYWSRIGAHATFAGYFKKVNGEEEPRDSYRIFGLYAVIEPGEGPLKGFRLDLGVDNIADTDYEVIASGVSEPGINFKAALGWTQTW